MRDQIKKNLSILVISDGINRMLVPLLILPYLTRVLGPETYGKYTFALNVAGFLILLAELDFVLYGIRAVAQNATDAVAIGAKISGIRLVFAATAMSVLVLYTLIWAPADNQLRLLIFLCGCRMLTDSVNLCWLLIGRSHFQPLAIADILGRVVFVVFIFLFVKGPSSVWFVPIGTLVGDMVCACIIYYGVFRNFGVVYPRFSVNDFREVVPTALLLAFASMMILMVDSVGTVILGYFCPMKEVGLYSATDRIIIIMLSFHAILSAVFLPIISESVALNADDHTDSILYIRILFFIALPITFGGILLAEPITKFLIGQEYAGSGLIFTLLLPHILACGLASYYASLKLFAANRNREYVVSFSAGAVCNLVLCLIFIPMWGATAAAVIASLSQFIIVGVAAWYCRNIDSPSIWGYMIRPLLACTVMVVLLLLTNAVAPDTHVLLLIVIAAAIYSLCWYAMGKTVIIRAAEVQLKNLGSKLGSLMFGSQ